MSPPSEKQRMAETALLMGTGGVSMFALLICLHAGIRPIITSSSAAKLDAVRAIASPGEIDTVDYSAHPDWEKEVLRLTGGEGADIVVENVGPATIGKSLEAVRKRGVISLIGLLGGPVEVGGVVDTVLPLLVKGAVMRLVSLSLGFLLFPFSSSLSSFFSLSSSSLSSSCSSFCSYSCSYSC